MTALPQHTPVTLAVFRLCGMSIVVENLDPMRDEGAIAYGYALTAAYKSVVTDVDIFSDPDDSAKRLSPEQTADDCSGPNFNMVSRAQIHAKRPGPKSALGANSGAFRKASPSETYCAMIVYPPGDSTKASEYGRTASRQA